MSDTALSASRDARALLPASRRTHWIASCLVAAALAAACLVGAARLVAWSTSEQVSFDGAMNLEVARSLAEGHGYNRLYAGRSGFTHEIQSRAPFIVPAAGVFAVFGIGIWQAQLTNLLYLAAFVAVVFALMRRSMAWPWALCAIALVLWTPQVREIAMNGYGEVPALVWWLASVLVLTGGEAPPAWRRWLGAGVLAGMAVLTKTVLAIGLVAMLPLIVAALSGERLRMRSAALSLAAFLVGVLLPAVVYELAHVLVLGDVQRWHAWLHDELHAIHMQAGTESGFHDTNGTLAKVAAHSAVLAENLGLPSALVPFWIAAPIAALIVARRAIASPRARAALVSLALFAAIYFVWWLGFTPTEKAWYRRIFDGVVVLEIVLVAAVAAVWKIRRAAPRGAAALACAVLIALQAPLIRSNIGADDESDFAAGDTLPADLAAMRRIPADAKAYGVGWYSAPIAALYSGRSLGNLTVQTPDELAHVSPVFLVLDAQTLRTGAAQYWLDRYSHRDVARTANLSLIELDAAVPRDPFAGAAVDGGTLRDRVDFHAGDYPYIFGFQNREGDGWRWAMADSEILLRYGGERWFEADIYLPSLRGYRARDGVGVTAWIGACRLGTLRQTETGRRTWDLPTTGCPLEAGQRVAVRLTSDNVYQSRDDRQLGYIVHALGFVDAPAGTVVGAAAQR